MLLKSNRKELSVTHPCDGHSCDHCYICDVVGICCMALSAQQRKELEFEHRACRDRLHALILQEPVMAPKLGELAHRDAIGLAGLLPAATRLGLLPTPASGPFSHDPRKEAIRVLTVPRPSR